MKGLDIFLITTPPTGHPYVVMKKLDETDTIPGMFSFDGVYVPNHTKVSTLGHSEVCLARKEKEGTKRGKKYMKREIGYGIGRVSRV